MSNSKWRCCKKDPPEEGKTVLCMQHGDFYVARRIGHLYIPTLFATHVFCKHLQYAEMWQEIEFPGGFTCKIRIYLADDINRENPMTLKEFKEKNESAYNILVQGIHDSVGCEKYDKKIRKNYKKDIKGK